MRNVTRADLITVFAVVVLTLGGQRVAAAACKADGQTCHTNQSCCSGLCDKSQGVLRGSTLFGRCCAPTTCAEQGKNCGTIGNGCGGTLNCGDCTAPQTCGGGGTANVCGCTPTTCAAEERTCGTIADGCGGSLDCGTCTAPDSCGGGGTPNVCGCTVNSNLACRFAFPTCGEVPDGCGGTLDCPCNECFCCCEDSLHPGECIPAPFCTQDCPPDGVLCALQCAGRCDTLYSTPRLSSHCVLSFRCPPECGETGDPCLDNADCCASSPGCSAGTCQ